MNVHDLFPSRYITAGDLDGRSFILTIKAVVLEEMQSHDNQKVRKPVVKFANAQKAMVLNRTNCMIIAGLYGPNTDAWAGKRIEIYPTRVKAFGSNVEAIRVREHIPALPKPAGAAAKEEEVNEIDDLDEVADYDAGLFEPDSEAA